MDENDSKMGNGLKYNFFKKVWYSITKFEKYPEMATLGVKKAILYFSALMFIFSAIYTATYAYYIDNMAEFEQKDLNFSQKVITYLLDGYEQEDEQSELMQMTKTLEEYPSYTMIIALFISFFIDFYIITLADVFLLSLFGIFTCLIAKIKMNYKAVFNMSIYALTLSIILRTIYVVLITLTSFKIKYFDVMYIAVSYISLAAAIFLIKSDVMKQHLQLIKIIEEGKEKIETTIQIPKKPKDDDDDNEEKDEKEDKKEKDEGTEEQGSNA